jgi:hypothetical protein
MTTKSIIRTVWGEYPEKIDEAFVSKLKENNIYYR